jgi:hypothetical protein
MIQKMIPALIYYGLVATAIPTMAQSTRQDTVRQLVMQKRRIDLQIDSLRDNADRTNVRLAREDSLHQKTYRELSIVEGSPRWRLDRRRIDSLNTALRSERKIKDSLQNSFDRLLMLLDSTLGVQQQINERIAAAKTNR